MREFNSKSISIVVGKYYHKVFPDRNFKITVFSHGIRADESSERITNMFYCYDSKYGLLGFAIHFASKNLRFYNHEGVDVGMEINMKYIPPKKGVQKFKIKH